MSQVKLYAYRDNESDGDFAIMFKYKEVSQEYCEEHDLVRAPEYDIKYKDAFEEHFGNSTLK